MPIVRYLVKIFSVIVLSGVTVLPAYADKQGDRFETAVRIGYVPHSSFSVDNGVTSGILANTIECSTKFFAHIEFVEMSGYDVMMRSLDSNVIDIGLNMVKSSQRDKLADYVMDLYKSRILLVGNDKATNNQGAGILAVMQGSGIDQLLLAKGYQVNTQAYSIDRLAEMYRKGLINSFAETEVAVFEALQAMDVDGVEYDYQRLADYAGGAYVSKGFVSKHGDIVKQWPQLAKACAYLTPAIDS